MRPEVFNTVVGTRFPFPVAYWFRRSLDRKDSREVACSLLLATLEFLGMVLISDYLAQEDRDEELDRELSRIFDSPLPAGVWRDWICRILQLYKARSRSPVLPELMALLDRSAQNELGRLLEWRNRWVHSSSPFNIGAFRRNLFNLFERIHGIHQSSLFCPQESRLSGDLHLLRVTLMKGDNDNFSEVEFRSTVPLETGQIYLYGHESREILPLHPLVLHGKCGECDESHYFHFSRPHGRKLAYSSIPSGHPGSSEESYLFLQQLFRVPKKRRVFCRHFSIPGDFAALGRTLKPGDHLGPYRVEELIKIGGMAQIYRVTDTRAGKPRALKLLPVELCRDPVLLMRFEEEAQNLKRLKHPNVVVLHDLGQDFGDHYLVLDLAIGGRIDGQVCRDLSDLSKPLSEAAIINVAKQICDGLHYIHSQGVIHRDLKPGNLLVSGERVLLTDFGISRARGENRITLTGMPVGTPEYMAPEQIKEGEIDNRADLYSLGCVLYELGTGRPPFRADTPLTTALYHLQSSPAAIEALNPRLSPGLVNIIYKCLRKNPDERYQNARQLFDDLCRVGQDPAGPQATEGEKNPQDIREEVRIRQRFNRRRLVAVVGGLLAILMLILWGPAAYRSWKTGSLVAEGRALESAGPVKWEEVCERIRDAYLRDPYHPAVAKFLADRCLVGGITITTLPPEGSRITISFRTEEEVGLSARDLSPRVLNRSGVFRSGERISATLGHYQATITFADGSSVQFPIFIGSEQRQRTPLGKWIRNKLLPGDRGLNNADNFCFAEEVRIEDVTSPGRVPGELCYVPPGPFWMSRYDDADFQAKPHRKEGPTSFKGEFGTIESAKDRELSIDSLNIGFLMGTTEVTIEEFGRWFGRFEKDCIGWLAEREADFAVVRMHGAGAEALEKYKVQYCDLLQDAAVEPEEISSLVDFHAAVRLGLRFRWERYAEHLRAQVLPAKGRLPMGWMRLSLALSYAQTHAPVIAGDFRRWLQSRIQECDERSSRLRGLAALRPEDLPEDLRFWGWGDRLRELVEPPLQGKSAGGWETARAALARQLKEKRSSGKSDFDLVGQWVEEKIGEETATQEALTHLLENVAGIPEGEEVPEIPWSIRLEYGWDIGWGLPTRAQWEKAFRGADARPFPWGDDLKWYAWVGIDPVAKSVDTIGVWNEVDHDRSPYGVRGLSGNIAEWVIAPGVGIRHNDFLKGGAFATLFPASARGDHLMRVALNTCSRWTGFRVVREVLPAGRYRRQLK